MWGPLVETVGVLQATQLQVDKRKKLVTLRFKEYGGACREV